MASESSVASASVTLRSSEDWRSWISIIKILAEQNDVWDYINPDLPDSPDSPDSPPVEPTEASDTDTPLPRVKAILAKPRRPEPSKFKQGAKDASELNAAQLSLYKFLVDDFKAQHSDYNEKRIALSVIQNHILKTASPYLSVIRQHSTVAAQLSALRASLAPSDYAHKIQVGQKYREVCAGPSGKVKVEAWLLKWREVLREAQEAHLSEVTDLKPTQDFLAAVRDLHPTFTHNWQMEISLKGRRGRSGWEHSIPDGQEISELFEDVYRVNKVTPTTTKPASFAATFQGQTTATSNTSTQPTQIFLCKPCEAAAGSPVHHRYSECPYVLSKFVKGYQPPDGWLASEKGTKALNELLKSEGQRQRLKKAAAWYRRQASKATEDQTKTDQPGLVGFSSSNSIGPTANTANTAIFSAQSTYPLRDSVIYDSGTDRHIANSVDRFQAGTLRPVKQYILWGNSGGWIEGIGTALATGTGPNGRPINITLPEALYIPGFHTNLISARRFINKGLLWNQRTNQIEQHGKPVLQLEERHGQYVVEFNATPSSAPSDTARSTALVVAPAVTACETKPAVQTAAPSKASVATAATARESEPAVRTATPVTLVAPAATARDSEPATQPAAFPIISREPLPVQAVDADLWHLRLGYPGKEALEQLVETATGVKIKGLTKIECQDCSLAKATRVVSRRPPAPPRRPFWKVHFDAFSLHAGHDGSKIALVIYDTFTGLTEVFPLATATGRNIIRAVDDFERSLQNRFDLSISEIHHDGEKALQANWTDWVNAHGIRDITTAPYTAAQNGSAERSGGVISTRARTLEISAKLPGDLWPEFWKTAAYLHNRTPRTGSQATPAEVNFYQRKVGSINYATTVTRVDAAKVASKLAEFLLNPADSHQKAADHCIQYLYGSRYLAIQFGNDEGDLSVALTGPISPTPDFIVASDASFADYADRKSSQGFLMKLFGGPVAWKAGKQATVTTSSTESELLALTFAAKETVATQRFFNSVQLHLDHQPTILCDNKQTIRLVVSDIPRLKTAVKHVDIHANWARQLYQGGQVALKYVTTTNMPADGLTKALPRQRHEHFVEQLGLIDIGPILGTLERSG